MKKEKINFNIIQEAVNYLKEADGNHIYRQLPNNSGKKVTRRGEWYHCEYEGTDWFHDAPLTKDAFKAVKWFDETKTDYTLKNILTGQTIIVCGVSIEDVMETIKEFNYNPRYFCDIEAEPKNIVYRLYSKFFHVKREMVIGIPYVFYE